MYLTQKKQKQKHIFLCTSVDIAIMHMLQQWYPSKQTSRKNRCVMYLTQKKQKQKHTFLRTSVDMALST